MKQLKSALAFIFPLLMGGCLVVSKSSGLPEHARLVGGGLAIHWQAPQAGTVILIEKISRKTISTQTLNEDDAFEFDVSELSNAEVIRALFGGELPKDARYDLYFVPSP